MEAWKRVNGAIEGGHFFEAVTICESIISDRLFSYIYGVSPDTKLQLHSPFAKLIKAWKKLAGNTLPEGLADDVDAWRKKRNSVVHGLVKSVPGRPTDDIDSFLDKAEQTALTGERLAREVSLWHKQQLRKVKNG